MGNLITGVNALYQYMAAKYGPHFTRLYKIDTFRHRASLRDIPVHHHRGGRGRITFDAAAVERWFEGQFSDPAILRRA